MSQLQTYYADYADVLEESPFKYELMGLNLLCLLALSRNAEFHVSVEKLPAEVLQKNHYIRHPVQLEQFIMEGNYNKASCNSMTTTFQANKFHDMSTLC